MQARLSNERTFYLIAAALLLAITFAGFARTYYLRSLFHGPPLTLFLHVHGVIMTGWIVLFLVQSLLIAVRRPKLHRQLGYAGAFLGAAVVAFGIAATVMAASREVRGHTEFAPTQLKILALEVMQMILFAVFLAGGIYFRFRTDVHKRFMLLATLCMLPNPEVRLLASFIPSFLTILVIWTAIVFACVAVDAARARRLHGTFMGAALLANAAMYFALFGSATVVWQAFATRLLS